MKFEYNLVYDLVNEDLIFEVIKMPESLKDKGFIKQIPAFEYSAFEYSWCIYSEGQTNIDINKEDIFLPGTSGNPCVTIKCCCAAAHSIATTLKDFQSWVEKEYKELEDMTFKELCNAKNIDKETAKLLERKIAEKIFDDLKGNVVTKCIRNGTEVWSAKTSLNDIKKKYGVKIEEKK